jgi:hypothetical protein
LWFLFGLLWGRIVAPTGKSPAPIGLTTQNGQPLARHLDGWSLLSGCEDETFPAPGERPIAGDLDFFIRRGSLDIELGKREITPRFPETLSGGQGASGSGRTMKSPDVGCQGEDH